MAETNGKPRGNNTKTNKVNNPVRKSLSGQDHPRNEVKKARIDQNTREDMISNFDTMLCAISKKPSMWTRPEFASLRSFVSDAASNPAKFPPLPPIVPACRDEAIPALPNFFANRLYAKEPSTNDAWKDGLPVVQITQISSKDISFHGMDRTTTLFTMHVVDGDGEIVTIKLNTSLTSRAQILEQEVILQLLICVPLYFTYKEADTNATNIAILLSRFLVLGRSQVADLNLLCPRRQRRQV
jgi:hypothetical protein